MQPFQFTRMIWGNLFRAGEVPEADYVNILDKSGTVDPKDLGAKLAGKLPLPRNSYEMLATLLNGGAVVCDNQGCQ
jgi:hypothetical protein